MKINEERLLKITDYCLDLRLDKDYNSVVYYKVSKADPMMGEIDAYELVDMRYYYD